MQQLHMLKNCLTIYSQMRKFSVRKIREVACMYEYDEECLQTFLNMQSQLFDEPVAETLEEAEAFLEDCMAVVCRFYQGCERLSG